MYNNRKDTTMPKMAGVWLTAEPMSMLVRRPDAAMGWRAMPWVAAPAGNARAEARTDGRKSHTQAGAQNSGPVGPQFHSGHIKEQEDKGHDHAEDGRSLTQRRTDKHVGGQHSLNLGVVGDALATIRCGQARTQAGAHGRQAHGKGRRPGTRMTEAKARPWDR